MKAVNGQVITEDEAKGLTDNNGKLLEWKEDKDTKLMSAEGSENPNSTATYNYTIDKVQPIMVRVTVTKNRKDMKQIIELKNKINKTDIDADDIDVQTEYKSRGAQSFMRDVANAPIDEKEAEKQGRKTGQSVDSIEAEGKSKKSSSSSTLEESDKSGSKSKSKY